VSKRTAEIAAKAFAGDVTLLHEAMGGALPRDAETLRVFVRLDFAERAVFNVYLWRGDRILGLRGTPVLPPLRYLPTSESEFAAFSLDGGGIERRPRIVERDEQLHLVVGPPDAPVEASESRKRQGSGRFTCTGSNCERNCDRRPRITVLSFSRSAARK